MGKFFGTDGIRGVANKELNCNLALKVGMAVANTLKKGAKVLLGKDPRISSDMLESSLAAGLTSMGVNVVSLGIIPTPAVSYLVKKEKADAGIMISASHNSFEFNGIKIFNSEGHKLSDEIEEKIESLITSNLNDFFVNSENIGQIKNGHNLKNDYINYLSSLVKFSSEKEIKILVDCSNGASCYTAKKLFEILKVKADFIFDSPNGININKNCGSTNILNLSKIVKEKNYDIAIAFDGDADRCLAVDNMGNIIDGDAILAICSSRLKEKNELNGNAVVGTIMSNMGLKKFCIQNNMIFYETKVGDRYVLEKMLKENYVLGAEQSGHVIFKNYLPTGCGELTAIKLIEAMFETGKKSSELNAILKRYPQDSAVINIDICEKGKILNKEDIKSFLESIKKGIGNKGRIVVRESGTEPKIRIMVEHEDASKVSEVVKKIADKISESLKK